MSKEIVIRYKWDKDLALKSFNSIYKYEYTHSSKRYIGWFFIALSQFGVVATLKKGDITLLLFSSIVIIYWYWLKKIVARKVFLKSFEKDPLKDKEIIIVATKNGLEIDNQFFSWEKFLQIEDVDNNLLLISKNGKHYFIPFNAFKSLEEKSEFKTLFLNFKKKQKQE